MHVANTLCARLNVRCIIVEDGREYSWPKLRRNLRPATMRAKLYRRIQPRLFPPDVDAARFFFPHGSPRFSHAELVRKVAHINAPQVVDLLRANKIELIAVFGTSLIRNAELFNLAPGRVLNLHGGLSPWYRGADSTFWALHNNEPDKIGCTIHRINRRIDAGELIAHVCPAIEPDEREHMLFCKAIQAAAPVYAEAIERIARGETLGALQSPGGKLYLHSARRLRHDRQLKRMYDQGCFTNVRLPERVTWHEQSPIAVPSPSVNEPQRHKDTKKCV
jgi:folate-dependent phosphoribosylglycinamide formyltransferase PurN